MTNFPDFQITYEQLKALGPCRLETRKALFKDRSVLTPQDAFNLGVSVSDFMWVLGQTGHKWVVVRMALLYAQRVASLNPDPRVQAAIDAGWAYAAARSTARSADAAAAAADAAAYADAAAADADAAYAADAADAAAAAADAADARIKWIDIFNDAVSSEYN